MRSKRRILGAVLGGLCLLGAMGGVWFHGILQRYRAAVEALRVQDVDLATVPDGAYVGSQDAVLVAAEVRVTVADGAIRRIEILRHENGRGKPAEAVLDRVIAAQSLRVDAVSGATSSSKVLLKAVENALRGAATGP